MRQDLVSILILRNLNSLGYESTITLKGTFMKNVKTMVSELGEVDVIVATFEKVEWLNFYIFFRGGGGRTIISKYSKCFIIGILWCAACWRLHLSREISIVLISEIYRCGRWDSIIVTISPVMTEFPLSFPHLLWFGAFFFHLSFSLFFIFHFSFCSNLTVALTTVAFENRFHDLTRAWWNPSPASAD